MRGDRGIELIEAIVVIAIIGILAGLLLPAIGAARQRAREQAARQPKEQVSYATKNSTTYEVTIGCSNCGKTHNVEYTFGNEVKFEHRCPHCGVEGKLSLKNKE